MKYLSLVFSLVFIAAPLSASAGTVTANSTLKRGDVLQARDLTIVVKDGEHRDDLLVDYVGKQVKRTIYAGHVLKPDFVGAPILVKRNSRVNMVYRFGRLEINAWGRALDEGSEGDMIDIMNLESRQRIQGIILASGLIEVRT